MMDDNPALDSRFTLFFDFLGSSAAATAWPRERVHSLVDLLIAIAQIESSENISGEAQEDGSFRLSVTPEVTTFSDNVVVSYGSRSSEEHPILSSLWTSIVCQDCIRILSGVAEMGLRIGVLIRGGLSFGQLYHQNGVVFGEGLVDAYRLENKIALNPRVVVSPRVIEKITHRRPEDLPFLLHEQDTWHLNYFGQMARHAASPSPEFQERARQWRKAHLDTITREISQLTEQGDSLSLHRSEKWKWFKNRFEIETSEFSDLPEQ